MSITEAKNRLAALIKAVENGDTVTICRRGKPVADLVPTAAANREMPKLGTLKGKIVFHDPDWWKPMSDEEVEEFLEGRY